MKAENAYLLLKAGISWKRVGKLFFLKDNTICFVFPNISAKGILAKSSCSAESADIQRIDLKRNGKSTSKTVKFSYHVDGNVHFSMDKKIYTKIKITAEPLSTENRHLFTCLYTNPEKFPNVTKEDYQRYSRNRLVRIGFVNEIPLSFTVSFHKVSLERLRSRECQKSNDIILLSPHDDKVHVRIVAQVSQVPVKSVAPLFYFAGGFRIGEGRTTFLSAMYGDDMKYDDLLHKLGTVDFEKQGRTIIIKD